MSLTTKLEVTLPNYPTSISSYGSKLCLGFTDGKIRIYDVHQERCITEIDAHDFGVNKVLFDKLGQLVISCGDDGQIKLWELEGQLVGSLLGHTNYVQSLALDSRNLLLLSGDTDNSCILWDVRNLLDINTFYHVHSEAVSSVDFSADSSVFLSASYDGTVHIWDTMSLNSIKTISFSRNVPVVSAKFLKHQDYIFSACLNHKIYLWDVMQVKSLPLKTYSGHSNMHFRCGNSFTDNLVYSGSEDAKIYAWDLESAKLVGVLNTYKEGFVVNSLEVQGELLAYTLIDKEFNEEGCLRLAKLEEF